MYTPQIYSGTNVHANTVVVVVVARVAHEHEIRPVRTGHSWAAQQTRIQTEGAGPATRARSPPGYGYDSLGVPTDLAVVPWRPL